MYCRSVSLALFLCVSLSVVLSVYIFSFVSLFFCLTVQLSVCPCLSVFFVFFLILVPGPTVFIFVKENELCASGFPADRIRHRVSRTAFPAPRFRHSFSGAAFRAPLFRAGFRRKVGEERFTVAESAGELEWQCAHALACAHSRVETI